MNDLDISGIKIDFAEHPVVDAEVLECNNESVTLRFPENRKYWIIGGKICFIKDEFKFMHANMPWQVYGTERMEMAAGRTSGRLVLKLLNLHRELSA